MTATRLPALALAGALACGPPPEFPPELHATYVPIGAQAFDPDGPALQLAARTLDVGALHLELEAGQPRESGYAISRARVTSRAHPTSPARACEGLLRKQSGVLDLELAESGTGGPCLDHVPPRWAVRRRVEALPDLLLGVYGGAFPDVFGAYGDVRTAPVRVEPRRLVFLADGAVLELEEIDWIAHVNLAAVIRRARFGDHHCRGHITREGERLDVLLAPTADAPPDAACPRMTAEPWHVDPTLLPLVPLVREGRRIAVVGDRLVITVDGEAGLRCEQRPLHTVPSHRSRGDGGRDRVVRVVLEPARPIAGADACPTDVACPGVVTLVETPAGRREVSIGSVYSSALEDCFRLGGVYAPDRDD